MTTRHIVRINPLHCSILFTVMYTIFALIVFLIGFLFTTVSSGFDLKQAFAGLTAETVWSAVAINLVLVFVGEAVNFVLNRWAIAWADALDHAGIHR